MSLKWTTAWLERRKELVRMPRRGGFLFLGAGPLARWLAGQLTAKQSVLLVDRNEEHCREATAAGLTVVNGNFLEESVLVEAHALEVQHVVAISPNPEINVMAAQFAKDRFLVPEVYALVSGKKKHEYDEVMKQTRIGALFRGAADLADWDRWVGQQRVSVEHTVIQDERQAQQLLAGLGREPVLPAIVRRQGVPRLDHSGLVYQPGDEVVMLRLVGEDGGPQDGFDRLLKDAVVLDLAPGLPLSAVFAQVADGLAPQVKQTPAALLAALTSREAESGTVLIARSRTGIAFAADGEAVHVLFAMASTRDERNFHLRCLAAIAQLVQNDAFLAKWHAAATPEDLRQLLLAGHRRRY
jgi:Trk K+ transport system NAD-binding subunit